MKTAGTNKSKKKEPASKPKKQLVKLWIDHEDQYKILKDIKRLTGIDVASKAIFEALTNFPKLQQRAEGLNSELQKLNRDYETLNYKMDAVKRGFNILMETNPKAKHKTFSNLRVDNDDDKPGVFGKCNECGNYEFDKKGNCTECGMNKYA